MASASEQLAPTVTEIGRQVQESTVIASRAVTQATTTNQCMNELSGAARRIGDVQDATTKEISRNVLEAAKGTSQVANNITDVSSGASETGSASSQVLASAKQLSQESGNLRREVESFIQTVRAA